MCAMVAFLEGMGEPQLLIFVSPVYDSYEYSVLGWLKDNWLIIE